MDIITDQVGQFEPLFSPFSKAKSAEKLSEKDFNQ